MKVPLFHFESLPIWSSQELNFISVFLEYTLHTVLVKINILMQYNVDHLSSNGHDRD